MQDNTREHTPNFVWDGIGLWQSGWRAPKELGAGVLKYETLREVLVEEKKICLNGSAVRAIDAAGIVALTGV